MNMIFDFVRSRIKIIKPELDKFYEMSDNDELNTDHYEQFDLLRGEWEAYRKIFLLYGIEINNPRPRQIRLMDESIIVESCFKCPIYNKCLEELANPCGLGYGSFYECELEYADDEE